MSMLTIEPGKIPTKDLHQFILGAVAPRPIAFASTISKDGQPNLAPYSFFNAFSSNPPILIFSSNRRVANNTTKDTLRNVEDTGEVVINVVSHSFVRQMALSSVEYGAEINEFEKAGFTPLPSEVVKPFRVAESPVQMECVVDQILPLGEDGGAGNLIICRIVRMHIAEAVLTDKGRIDPDKIDLMGRMGRFYYVRASGAAVEEIMQDVAAFGIGFDQLPAGVKQSTLLTGNELAQLAALTHLPNAEEARAVLQQRPDWQVLLESGDTESLHRLIRELIAGGAAETALQLAVLA
ncbi:MAG: flavin reductase family protein [Chitinophagales bacterium]|nr:flavin reductase family protein [Chitinophagales bacterium]